MANTKKQMTMGVIVGNRGLFPDHLAKTGREEILAALAKAGGEASLINWVVVAENSTFENAPGLS